MTLLTLEHVTRRFGGLVAVNDVDLRVEPGAVTAIIGPNGAGKTTLFHLISGFQTPDEGRIMFEGNDITGSPPEQIAALRAGADVSAGAAVPRPDGDRERQGRLSPAHARRRAHGADPLEAGAAGRGARSRPPRASCSVSSGSTPTPTCRRQP